MKMKTILLICLCFSLGFARVIETVAGTGDCCFEGDGGPATAALFNIPSIVKFGPDGNMYISDRFNHRIRQVAENGVVTTIAGAGAVGAAAGAFSGDNGPALNAEFDRPTDIVFDEAGNIFVADASNNRIRFINRTTGIITTFSGNGNPTFSGDNEPFNSPLVSFRDPTGLAFDSTRNLYIADRLNSRIRKIDFSTGIITTFAGNGIEAFTGDNGPATLASLNRPFGIAFDTLDNLYIADRSNNCLRKVDNSTGIIVTIIGNGTSALGEDNILAILSTCQGPSNLVVDVQGNIFFTDKSAHRIRVIEVLSGFVRTLAGNGTRAFEVDAGPASLARFNDPTGITIGPDNNLYIGDEDNNRIRKISLCTSAVDCGPCFQVECLNGECVNATFALVGTSCNNDVFCDGNDVCDAVGNCLHGGSPCSNLPCLECNENSKKCGADVGSPCSPDDTYSDNSGNIAVCQGEFSQKFSHIKTDGKCSAPLLIDEGLAGKISAGILVPILVIGAGTGTVVFFVIYRNRKRQQLLQLSQSMTLDDVISISNVEIEKILGTGNFGQVFKGKWVGTLVAMKKLKDTSKLKEFVDEAKLLKELKHPHIVQFFGVFNSAEHGPLLVVEFMNQGSVEDALQKNSDSFSLEDLSLIVSHALKGMVYLESRNILHRDLAARNLLIAQNAKGGDRFTVKVSDFGLGRMIGDENYYSSTTTTIPVRWSAPEVFKFHKYYPKSDVWSFGIVMWEVYSKCYVFPYHKLKNDECIQFVLDGKRLEPPKECPPESTTWMLKCWADKYQDRPSFADLHLGLLGEDSLKSTNNSSTTSSAHATVNVELRAQYVE